jgi:hypothetical protein
VPFSLAVCEIDNHSNCLATPAPTITLFTSANDLHYYSVFLLGQGQPIPYDPYYKRFFFRILQGQNAPTGPLIGSAGLSVITS